MDEYVPPKFDTDSKLQRETDKLEQLKDSLARSNQMTTNMMGILESFNGRLKKLEETITPVYQETGNLQRRHENIEKTLTALDHVIGYYHVTEEIEPVVRDGPGSNLDQYLACMEKLRKAVVYFNTHNPGTSEMSQVMTSYEAGKFAIESEFRKALQSNNKPVPAITLLDVLAVDEDLPNEEQVTIEHLPPKVHAELAQMAGWLQNLEGTSSDYMEVYSQCRSQVVVNSLQVLRDHLKSGSRDSGHNTSLTSSTNMTHSPLMGGRHRPSRDTPTKRSMRKMAFLKQASNALKKSTLAHLDIPGMKQHSATPEEDSAAVDIDNYIATVSGLLSLIQSEAALMVGIIPDKHQRKVFDKLLQAAMDSVVKEGEQIGNNIRLAIGRKKYTAVLSIFPVLKHLRTVKPDFDTVLDGLHANTKTKIPGLIASLDATGAKALEEYLDNVKNDPDKASNMPKDGTVHQLTSNTIIFLEQLLDFADTAGNMLVSQNPQTLPAMTKKDKPIVKLAEFVTKVLSSLGLNLSNKSETYGDSTMRSVFMLNNYNYILKSLKRTGLLDLVLKWNADVELFYHDQVLEQKRLYSQRSRMLEIALIVNKEVENYYFGLVLQQKKLYMQSWSRVLHYIQGGEIKPGGGRGAALKDKERQLIKDKFTGFNKEVDDLSKVQKSYSIPDSDLREALKKDNKDYILPKYEQFLKVYKNTNFTKNPEKYVKHTVADVSRSIDGFFDSAA